jgi:Icc-related predicted phosphoesterase
VCGVAGNHDLFGTTPAELAEFAKAAGIYYLDGDTVSVDSFRIGGVGGIIGRASKDFRRSEAEYRITLRQVLAARPDLLVLHSGPDVPSEELPGSAGVRDCLMEAAPTLVVCGHCYWESPFQFLANGTQVCNVDSRVVVLQQKVAAPGTSRSEDAARK